jgi:hypothetical protein
MNILTLFRRKRIPLRPDSEYRERRLAQLSPERRERYRKLVREVATW